ncbi:MAG: type II toxin-antitoxin system VapC family toxin [Caulobacter sp.]|nr:type II toxin-antitoxin system VapC family toxin [Caulobacter sp.]
MTTLVVDASVAIKWVTYEPGTPLALLVHDLGATAAPDLLVAECANILWKKYRRGQVGLDGVATALAALETVTTGLWPIRRLVGPAFELARRLDHPAYDCFYLALAAERDAPFVTADLSLVRKLRAAGFGETEVLTLAETAALAG